MERGNENVILGNNNLPKSQVHVRFLPATVEALPIVSRPVLLSVSARLRVNVPLTRLADRERFFSFGARPESISLTYIFTCKSLEKQNYLTACMSGCHLLKSPLKNVDSGAWVGGKGAC